MADHQRIHPVDLEAGQRPSAPLVPGGSFRSDKGDPAQRADHQQRTRGHGYLPPPPRLVAPPVPLPPPKRRRGCCCRFLCCIVVTVVVLAVLAAAAVGALYLAFDPKAPRYSVDRLSVSAFQVDPMMTARARFDVTVTAVNPNARIGIYYEAGSSLSVWYESYSLAQGALPAFYQGHRNTTVLALAMGGEVQLGSVVMTALQDAQRTGAVPLVFRADVPVRVELGSFKLWKVTSKVRCDLVVDRLMDVNSPIKIKASNCKFSLKL
ncbi:NDR1/HIN1-like protein 6 [Phragmites australis]|uniref:NDR1/HIN1-like protein 6 n=1 Tax=Phragmites australis TaxID=29695 RepID=UPI002D77B87F|nr:NDR1/HIN1-like protein 6 [Phragmites australis]